MDIIVWALKLFGNLLFLGVCIGLLIDQLEIRKTQFGWRSSWLGRVLGVHSQSAELVGKCWCQSKRRM